ncbi:hypothetical protein PTKIN_Ptkin14bG0075900 [Pterospermum kingtungense]
MSSLPSSSSLSSISGHKYDVFLSFRGEDTRKRFIDHLYASLRRKGLITFRDDPDINVGEEIRGELLKAIQESLCSIIVFSETYVFSSWCLEELAEIVKQKMERGHKVFPVFYEVDPSDLRKQTGKVKEAFAKHEERYKEDKDKIQRWRTALTEVVNVKGWDSRNKHEPEFIEDIVEKIYLVVPCQLIGPIFVSKDFMPSESSNLTFNQIINALNTNGLNMIGLYGMPGVGKTTLAKEVLKHAKEQKLFDHVLMVTMSQTPDLNKIQNRIAESLHWKFEASTEEGKSEELWRRLKDMEKILIIIDDVWKEFELHTIGIPFGVEQTGCKILLTMRDQRVCVKMNCQEKFHLDILSENKAWALFKNKAGLEEEDSELNDVAKEVASECKGLPLAIVTIGTALKGECLNGWVAANKRFKDSRHLDNEDVCEGLYNRLLLSYEYLKGDNIRSCFLLCSLFPEDFDIGFESLVILGIGFGLFSCINSFEDLRREIHLALRKLQESCLLLETKVGDDGEDNERYVRMHDVIRDFAHWITLKEKHIYMVKEGLRKWPRESFECCAAISFLNNGINNFPKNLEFSKLKILIFEGNNLVKIPSLVVEGMKVLRVLHLRKVVFSLDVLEFMINLRTLCFEDCNLKSISSLRNMENLEILALNDTNIFELPEELVALCALKSLHFSFSGKQRGYFPPNLLSRLTSLQELHVTCENNVNLSELKSLSGLTTLSLRVSTAQCFPENFVFSKLERYIIAVNRDLGFMEGLNFRTLRINDFSPSLSAFKKLFCNVEKLTLWNVKEHKNIVPSIDQKGLNVLTSLQLRDCDDMECLIAAAGEKGSSTAFSNLVKLYIERMDCLKGLWHGSPPIRFLQKLKDVYVADCAVLKVVFPIDGYLAKEEISQTQLFSNLTSLDLWSLPKLESIWKLQPTHQCHHASLRSLKVVTIRYCHKLKYVFSTCLSQSLSHLQQLKISSCYALEQVFDFPQEMVDLQEENEVQPISNLTSLDLRDLPKLRLIWKGPSTHLVISLQRLKIMTINGCRKLASLFPAPLAQSLVHLEVLQIRLCRSLNVIIEEAENEDEIVSSCRYHRPLLPNLTSLDLSSLLKLESIWKLQPTHQYHHATLQSLKVVKIQHCNALKSIFLACLSPCLLHLQQLTVSDCDELEHVFDFPQETGELKPTHQYHASLQSLKNVTIQRCNKLKSIFSTCVPQSLLHLQQLEIFDCDRLAQVFDFPQEMDELEENQVCLLSDLTSLKLVRLPQLKGIWKGPITYLVNLYSLKTMIIYMCKSLQYLFPTALVQSLVHLEVLHLRNCNSLKYLIVEEAKNEDEIVSNIDGYTLCWPKLKTLRIWKCKSLKYVFPITLAQGLPNLESVEIIDCSRLKHVFNLANQHGGSRQQDILLQRLQILQLENLENLSSFCLENFAMSLTSLKEFKIGNCPRLSIEQVLKTLQADLKLLLLSSLTQLQRPIQVATLQKLRDLNVYNCNRLKFLFSSLLAQNLPQLITLRIMRCKWLEEIIATDDQNSIASSSSQVDRLQPIFFPSLESIWINGCSNLKRLFPVSVAHSLSKLTDIKICGSSKLEQVFGCQGELNMEDDRKGIVFPELKNVELLELQSLESFSPMGYHFRFPSLNNVCVRGCPNLVTSFHKNSGIVHTIREALLEGEYNTSERSCTMEEIDDEDDIFLDCSDTLPLTITVEETEDNVTHKEMTNNEKLVS